MPPQRKGQRSADFAEQFLEMPPIKPLPGLDNGRAGIGRTPTRSADIRRDRDRRSAAILRRKARSPPALRCRARPSARPSRCKVRASLPLPRQTRCGRPRPGHLRLRSADRPSGGADAILRAIATGAGVSPDIFLQRPASDVAAEIGVVLRTVVEELALLLKARAAAKVLAKSGNRTMISAVDNNPLKFVPRRGRSARDHVRQAAAPDISTPSTASTRRFAT